MWALPVSNIILNQQQAEITKVASEPLSATPTLQETLDRMVSKRTQLENTLSQMQAYVNVSNLQYFQLPNLSSKPPVPLAAEAIPNSRFPFILE